MVEILIDFMEEYKIKADEEVKKALIPMMLKIKKWIKDETK